MKLLLLSIHITLLLISIAGCSQNIDMKKEITLRLEPREGNYRNSEGDFIKLNDGRILFIYSHFTEGTGDNAGAHLAGRYSQDEGETWTTEDFAVLENEGDMNIMSVSLFRLLDDRIALFYLRKNSESDCIPYMRTSDDEANSWSEATRCIPDSGYFVVNNDRVVRLNSGRILFPVSLHKTEQTETSNNGKIRCYYSDDDGKSWNKGNNALNPDQATTQEPGVIELKNGRLMLFCRTESGTQYSCYSSDQGENWSTLKPSNIKSPLSPASIERIPKTGDLMLVWNNNYKPIHDGGKRTPLNLAISKNEGATWEKIKPIESDPNGWYCYTAIEFIGDHILLGHCAGDRSKNIGLETTQITRLNLDWIYGDATSMPSVFKDSNGTVELRCTDNDAKIFYSLDRKMPNKLYVAPISVSRPTPLWMQAKGMGKSNSELISVYVGMDIYQPAISTPIKTGQGLIFYYYQGIVSTVDSIHNLDVTARGVSRYFNIDNRQQDVNFAYIFNGYLSIPQNGKYTFYLSSNDGSVLYLDDHELINIDGPHAMTEESVTIALHKGEHKIDLKYFQMMGGQGLTLSWKGPGFEKQEIPSNLLSH